jgi:hypothetical protein
VLQKFGATLADFAGEVSCDAQDRQQKTGRLSTRRTGIDIYFQWRRDSHAGVDDALRAMVESVRPDLFADTIFPARVRVLVGVIWTESALTQRLPVGASPRLTSAKYTNPILLMLGLNK